MNKQKIKIMRTLLLLVAFATSVTFANAQFTKIFDLDSINGKNPIGGSFISDGIYLYGMTALGGVNDYGTIFKIKPDGTDYQKLLDFNGVNGRRPFGTLINDGTYLYGMTELGGTENWGVIFKIKPDGTDYTILEDLDVTKGGQPFGSLILEGSNLYGISRMGGSNHRGVIFKIDTNGTGYSKLLDFVDILGSYPIGTLVSDGTYLYGMTLQGAANGTGGVFRIMLDGTNFLPLHDFPSSTNANVGTHSSLLLEGGYLYGSSRQGGTNGIGNLFKVKTDGTDYQNLLDFDSSTNGIVFSSTLYFDGTYLYGNGLAAGAYGKGSIYRMYLDGTNFETLYDFDGTSGETPGSEGLFDDGNNLYGMTTFGGVDDFGVIFKLEKSTLSTNSVNLKNEVQITVYPNPVQDKLIIETEKVLPIRIVNALGATVLETQIEQGYNTINLTSLTSGIYFIQSETSTFKLIKE
mgnify:CR=1 FL=1